MKAIYSHGCGQIATVSLAQSSRLVNRPLGNHGMKASFASLFVASVIIVVVVIIAGVHCQCHRHRPWHEGQFEAKG